jgi:hypothetical protein
LVVCDNLVDGIDLINNTLKAVVMTSGGMGWALIPKIQNFKNIWGVTVFCGNHIKSHMELKTKYNIVKLVTNDEEEAVI